MKIKGREINVNKKILIVVGIIAFIVVGFIGKGNNEEKRMIENSIKAIEAGDYEYARTALGSVVEGNNKKVDKLWNIVTCYQSASEQLYSYNNIDKAKEYLDKMNNDYKKYDKLKADVDKVREEIEFIESSRAEYYKKLEKVRELMNNGDYYSARELIRDMNEGDTSYATNQQSNESHNLDYECIKNIGDIDKRKKAWKLADEKFTFEKVKEYAKDNIDTEMCEFTIDDTLKYNEEGFKYYDVIYKYKGSGEIVRKVRLYSTGNEDTYMSLEEDNSEEVEEFEAQQGTEPKYFVPHLNKILTMEEMQEEYNKTSIPFDYINNGNTYIFNPGSAEPTEPAY